MMKFSIETNQKMNTKHGLKTDLGMYLREYTGMKGN